MQVIYKSGRKLRKSAHERVDDARKTPFWAIVAVAAGVFAVVCLVSAANQNNASVLVLATLGTVFGSGSIWYFGRRIGNAVEAQPHQYRLVGPLLILLGLLLTIVSVTIAARLDSEWPILLLIGASAAGLLATMIGILVVNRGIASEAVENPRLWLIASAIVFFTALLSIGTGTPALLTTIALVIWVMALTTLKISLTPLIRQDTDAKKTHTRALRVFLISVAFVFIGLILLVWDWMHDKLGPEPFATSFSLALILLALSTAAIGAVNADVSTKGWLGKLVFGAGSIATLLGIWLSVGQLPKWPLLVTFICLVLFLIGAFFVLKGEGLIFLILFGFLMALVLVPRFGTDTTADNPVANGSIVIFGDSFTSGEGASQYLSNTNTQAETGNWCRRSPRSYGELVGELYDMAVINVSCSGATTEHILEDGQFEREGEEGKQDVAGELPQIDSFSLEKFDPRGASANVELVLLSVGGNDAKFSTVVKACLLPADCADAGPEWLSQAAATGPAVEQTYRKITEMLPDAQIVVIPYPSYVGFSACGKALSDDEVLFVRTLISTINAQAKAASEAEGLDNVHYFDDLDRAYLHHTLCSGKPGANFLNLLPRTGNLLSRFAPDSWHNGTAHPNDRGHRCTTAVLAPWLEDNFDFLDKKSDTFDDGDCRIATEVELARALDEHPLEAITPAPPCPQPEPGEPSDCFDGNAWVSAQLGATVNKLAIPLGLLVLGGLMLALAAVWRLREGLAKRRSDPDAEPRALDIFVPEAPDAYQSS